MDLPPSDPRFAPQNSACCEICGGPADGAAVWMVAHPLWAHERCIDWTLRPFPYAWKLQGMRSFAGSLLRTYHAVVDVGTAVADAQREWPKDALGRLEFIRRLEADLSLEMTSCAIALTGPDHLFC